MLENSEHMPDIPSWLPPKKWWQVVDPYSLTGAGASGAILSIPVTERDLASARAALKSLAARANTSLRVEGMSNRRLWDDMESTTPDEDAVVVMLDLDNFKMFNSGDAGTKLGDDIIGTYGKYLMIECRKFDPDIWPIHYGGDEFLVVLEAKRLDGFRKLFADKLCCHVVGGHTVWASGGFCAARHDSRPWKELKNHAEKALKVAKSQSIAQGTERRELVEYTEALLANHKEFRLRCPCQAQFIGMIPAGKLPLDFLCPFCKAQTLSVNKEGSQNPIC